MKRILFLLGDLEKMINYFRFESKDQGVRIHVPLYLPQKIAINATFDNSSRREKNIEFFVDSDSIIKPRLIEWDKDLVINPRKSYLSEGHILKPNSKGQVNAIIILKKINYYSENDLYLDEHIDYIVKEKAEELGDKANNKYEIAKIICDYVNKIKFEKGKTKEKYKAPSDVIKSNKANKCVCKAELFKDLCRILRIPARRLGVEFYDNKNIDRLSKPGARKNMAPGHAYNAFFYDCWHLVDPTGGEFDDKFKIKNYYNLLIFAKGMDSFDVNVREI